jgi:hypothetical protein
VNWRAQGRENRLDIKQWQPCIHDQFATGIKQEEHLQAGVDVGILEHKSHISGNVLNRHGIC